MPTIWRGECKMLPGGFALSQSFVIGTVIFRGAPICVDFDTMTAAVCKTARVVSGGSTSAPRVSKCNYFQVGDRLMKVGKDDASPTITAIDSSNAGYDVLTLSAAISGLAANNVLVEASGYVAAGTGTSAVSAAPLYEPNMILGADCVFTGRGLPTLDAAYEAVVLYSNITSPILDDWKVGVSLKNNPNIIFIKQ